jgi:hypothetical protein
MELAVTAEMARKELDCEKKTYFMRAAVTVNLL